jgi:mono/diheme cytochrome c family protein
MKNLALLPLVLLVTIVWVGIGDAGNSKGEAGAGSAIYEKQCLRCHGEQGKGDGPASKLLKTKPHDLTDKAFMGKLSDEDLFKIIAKGGEGVGKSKLMPAYEQKLKEKEIRDLVAFIRSLAKN